MRTWWFCEQCKRTDWTYHDKDADIATVVNEINTDHTRYGYECTNDVTNIRVVNLQQVLGAELPDWVVATLVEHFSSDLIT